MQNPEEPDAEPGAECRTPCCQFFGGNADFEVNFLALKEETDGIFLSYTVVQCTPSVCDALAKSRNEFYQASQSHKVVLHWLPLKQGPSTWYYLVKGKLNYYILGITLRFLRVADTNLLTSKDNFSNKTSRHTDIQTYRHGILKDLSLHGPQF